MKPEPQTNVWTDSARTSSAEFVIDAKKGMVSVLMQIRPLPSTTDGDGREWDEQAAVKARIEPMLARHIGHLLIDQAALAERQGADRG